jgi:hypothetical protein
MHRANWSIADFRAADSGGGWPPLGSSDRQLCIADLNAGALTLTPFTVIDEPEPTRADDWISIPPLPLLPGSGKLGTPCARMHFAKATILSVFAALVDASEDEPHAASPAAAMIARRGLVRLMPVVYENAGNTAGTVAVTAP